MALSRHDPYHEMASLREAMNRLLDQSVLHARDLASTALLDAGTIPLDVYEEGNNLVVKASLPGVRPEEVKIELRGEVLTISGETRQETERKEQAYHLQERASSHFVRSVVLPVPVQSDQAEAVFENGVLTLTLPKAEAIKPKRLQIKTK